MKSICLKKAKNLIDLKLMASEGWVYGLIKSLPENIQRLSIGSFFNKKIPYADIIPPTLVKSSFNSIKYLNLRDVKLNERGGLLYIGCVLKSAPSLVELVLECYSRVDITQASDRSEELECSSCCLNQLKTVNINNCATYHQQAMRMYWILSFNTTVLLDQTIEDIDKVEKTTPEKDVSLSNIDPVRLPVHNLDTIGGDVQNGEPHDYVDDQQLGEEVYIPADNDEENDMSQDENLGEAPESSQVQLRRSNRQRQPSTKYYSDEYVTWTDEGEPEYFQEAMESDENQKWLDAMNDEMKSLHDNHTYDLMKLPKGKRALENRWIYRVKHESNSESPRYKARLVVKGFRQRKGVDFNEIFSPVVKMSSIRTMLGLAATLGLEVEQMHVKTTFLHGDLEEEIYMKQPDGFQVKRKEDYVCRLRKSLYGLKQAPRQWYKKFESVMSEQGYKKTTSDHCVFVRKFSNDDFIILLLYVDDMLIVGKNISNIDRLKKQLGESFAMKDMGEAKQILGIRITRDRKEKKLWMSQEHYIKRVLQRFQMENSKAVSTPLATHFKLSSKQSPSNEDETFDMKRVPYASAVGSLMYAMVCTRPDIAHVVGTVSRFLSNPGREHWNAVKWVLRYLRGTTGMRLCFGGDKPTLEGYSDSDMAGDIDFRKSTSGYMIKFAGGVVAWQSRLQKCVALSTTKAEFIVITEACKELLWLKKFLQELGFVQDKYVLFVDSQSVIHLGKNPTFHNRSKHIDVRYHWIRDVLDAKLLELAKVHTDDNVVVCGFLV
ncbi:unnamed protein product [Trifolium pratense]|uniref:Uncharacterized protein n=1 Tax=Trifolium pratense TaxID=57577 RepID=A0ACB0LPS0_TRIPR|nr:unnamed protein product [Trifolium pratense]